MTLIQEMPRVPGLHSLCCGSTVVRCDGTTVCLMCRCDCDGDAGPEPSCAECHRDVPAHGGELCAACSADQEAIALAHGEIGL